MPRASICHVDFEVVAEVGAGSFEELAFDELAFDGGAGGICRVWGPDTKPGPLDEAAPVLLSKPSLWIAAAILRSLCLSSFFWWYLALPSSLRVWNTLRPVSCVFDMIRNCGM